MSGLPKVGGRYSHPGRGECVVIAIANDKPEVTFATLVICQNDGGDYWTLPLVDFDEIMQLIVPERVEHLVTDRGQVEVTLIDAYGCKLYLYECHNSTNLGLGYLSGDSIELNQQSARNLGLYLMAYACNARLPDTPL